jgi:uncharacterized RDD family membrane protein YckC
MSDGWHDDPFGRYSKRYHDGTNWTAYVSNAGVTEQDPLGVQPSPPGMPTAPPVTTYQAAPAGPQKGNAFLRFIARIIDGLILSVPFFLFFGSMYDDVLVYETDFQGDIIWDTVDWNFPVGIFVLQFVLAAAYEIFMVGSFGRTVGKMAVGVSVVRGADGSRVDFGVATVRYLSFLIYAIPLVGFILFIITAVKGFTDPKGKTLHDSIASTMVAKTSTVTS